MPPAIHSPAPPALDKVLSCQQMMQNSLLENIPDAACYKDCSGLRLDCNEAYARLLGKRRVEVIGRNNTELFGAEMAAKFAATDRQAMERNALIVEEEWVTLPDGTKGLFETRKAPFRNGAGELLGLLVISREITGQRRLEADLKQTTERLALALRAGGMGVWDADIMTGRVLWDDQIHRLYGTTPEQFTASYQAWLDRVHPDDLERVVAETNQAMIGDREYVVNFRIRRPDGGIRHLRAVGWMLRDATGAVLRVVGTNTDVTDQVLAQQEIQRQAALITSLLECIPDTVYLKDLEGIYQLVNPPFARDLGRRVEDVLGRTDYDLFAPEVAAMFRANDLAAIAAEGPVHAEEWVPQLGGGITPFDTVKTAHTGPDGAVVGVIGISRNITERKRIEQGLRASEESYRNQFEHSSAVMLMIDPDSGRIIAANHAAESFYGYPMDRFKGMPIGTIHTLGDDEIRSTMAAVGEGLVQLVQFRQRLADGSLRDVEVQASRINFQGRPAIHTIVHDISARIRAERELIDKRNRLDSIIRGTNVGTWEWNFQTGEIIVNERWAEILGHELADLLPITSSKWGEFVHPDDALRVAARVQEHFSGLTSQYVCELRLRHRDGGWVWVLSSGRVAQWTADGQPAMVFGTHLDITQRKRFEEELGRAAHIQRELVRISTTFVNIPMERQTEAIQQSLAAMGGLIGADHACLFSYDFAAGQVFMTHEWCPDGMIPRREGLQRLPLEGYRDAVEAHLAGRVFMVVSVASLPAGHYLRPILERQGIQSLVALPMFQNGKCTGFVAFESLRGKRVWTDEEISLLRVLAELYANFSERVAAELATRELQERLVTARDEARATARAKSLFLGDMSHEIRTPLNCILGYAQIMELEDRNSPNSGRLRAITRSAEHLLTLINDLLEQVRNDDRSVTPVPEHFDFRRMLEDMRLMFARRAEAQGLVWDFSVAPDLPQFIHADQGKIRQILVNLIGNAFKFTRNGGILVTSSVFTSKEDGQLLLAVEVKDTGSGIRAAELDRIFEIFEQSASGRNSGKGTGLGLFLSRRYARALGGEIVVSSEPDRGSCFRFTFRAASSTAADVTPKPAEVTHLATDQPLCRVLVVDDDSTNTEMLSMMLGAAGFAPEVARSGAAALARLARSPRVNLVLMDKRMPDMDGYETIRRLHELPGGDAPPVLVVTASGFSEERALALAAGADGFIAKPVNRAALFGEIGRILGVRFEYETAETQPQAADGLPSVADFAALPETLRQRFKRALDRGHVKGMQEALAAVALERSALADHMRSLVEAYDYDSLHALMDAARALQS
ncbi:MAG: PAS domain S-box protein [Verrucomicrobiota bacterium]